MGPRALKVLSVCLWSCRKRSSLQNFTKLIQPLLPVSPRYEQMIGGSLGGDARREGVFSDRLHPPLPLRPLPLLFLCLVSSVLPFARNTHLVSFLMGRFSNFFPLTTDSMTHRGSRDGRG
ncbi:hypothetical protein EYF80_008645 [Liparis tanakae]|uniref:Uncharacterized protein n=1 Tax=Liparis tanakae TaxID=230148 RepID=A0A4Z2ISK7_9TELE|nr:hypothetical protein EYF80_008645 [Liparis tanakae]